MTKAENLIIKGEFAIPRKIESRDEFKNYVLGIKNELLRYVVNRGFVEMPPDNLFAISHFYTVRFGLELSKKTPPPLLKIKSYLKSSNDEINSWKYFEALKTTRSEYPFEIEFRIKYNEKAGFIITAISEPALYFKISQLGYKHYLDEFTYSTVIVKNKEFLRGIMAAIGANEIEEPKPISAILKTPIGDKLEYFGLSELKKLLENGAAKVDKGTPEDGLTDLRSVLEQFITEMVEKIGLEPKKKIFENLKVLKDNGYIDETFYSMIHGTLYEWIYRYLSNKAIHKREKVGFDDAKLLFSISEEIMDYLLDKVVLRK